MPKLKNPLGRGEALQKDRYRQVQARPVEDAPHPHLQGDQDQEEAWQDHPGVGCGYAKSRPDAALRLRRSTGVGRKVR